MNAGLIVWPAFVGSLAGNTRFLLVMIMWAMGNAYVVRRALQRPLDPATPRYHRFCIRFGYPRLY